MPTSMRWAISLGLPLLVVGAIAGTEFVHQSENASAPVRLNIAFPDAGFGPADHEEARQRTERRLALARERVTLDSQSWLPRQVLSRALSRSYATHGDFAALVEAGRELAEGRRLAVAGSGPNLVTAEWAMSVHDLSLAERSLDAFDAQVVKLSRSEETAAMALRGDLAFYRGDMAAARAIYRHATKLEPGPGVLVRQATVAKAEGDFDQAVALLIQAASADTLRTPQGLANISIQIGAIEFARGRYADASEWYSRASTLFPNYWKTRLYQAEAALLSGRTQEAIALLEGVAEYNSAPEAMDALAMIYRHLGDRENSVRWSQRAKAEWSSRIDALPSAAIAHAAEHELAFGDARQALDMARRNVAARPYGEARVLLAKALNANGRYADARKELLAAEESGWKSAMLFVELARSEEAQGNADAAANARQRAIDLNPEIMSTKAALVWFAHG